MGRIITSMGIAIVLGYITSQVILQATKKSR